MAKWFDGSDTITLSVADAVATVTLSRPDKRNALTLAMMQDLRAALLEADDRTDVNAILLQGAGPDFCSGYDIADNYDRMAREAGMAQSYRKGFGASMDDDIWRMERNQELLLTVVQVHKPVVAKIHGRCLAGGMDLALYCDIVIAGDAAQIGFPATRANGTPPSQMWSYHLGPQWAKRMLFTGDSLSGRDAAVLGLIMDSYPDDTLDAEADALVRRIALTDADLLAAHKRIVNLSLELRGANTMTRLGLEMDARAHLSSGPRTSAFRDTMESSGLRAALRARDEDYGASMIRLGAARRGGAE